MLKVFIGCWLVCGLVFAGVLSFPFSKSYDTPYWYEFLMGLTTYVVTSVIIVSLYALMSKFTK